MADKGSQTMKAVVAAVVLLLAAVLVARQIGVGGGGVSAGFYYDLQTGNRFAADMAAVPPIDAPSGAGNGVRAEVFACGSCQDASAQFVGWLVRYPADVKAEIESLIAQRDAADEIAALQIDEKILEMRRVKAEVRLPDGGDWVNSQTPQANIIYEKINSKCTGDAALAQCRP